MEAYDELMPNARPEDRETFARAMKAMPEDRSGVCNLWLVWLLYLIGKTLNLRPRKTERTINVLPMRGISVLTIS